MNSLSLTSISLLIFGTSCWNPGEAEQAASTPQMPPQLATDSGTAQQANSIFLKNDTALIRLVSSAKLDYYCLTNSAAIGNTLFLYPADHVTKPCLQSMQSLVLSNGTAIPIVTMNNLLNCERIGDEGGGMRIVLDDEKRVNRIELLQ